MRASSIALGGNALLRRGEPAEAATQAEVARRWPPDPRSAAEHQVVVTHGNGPQVGLLALQSEAYGTRRAVPARRPRCRDRRPDRLPARAGARQRHRPPRRGDRAHPGGRRPRRPGLRPSNQVHRTGLHRDQARAARPRARMDDHAGRRALAAGGGLARAAPIVELDAIRHLSTTGLLSSAPAAAACPSLDDADGQLRGRRGRDRQGPRRRRCSRADLAADALLLLTDVDAV